MDHRYLEKELGKKDTRGCYPLLVGSDCEIAMRGINYRSSEDGILLLVLKPFAHQRQAM